MQPDDSFDVEYKQAFEALEAITRQGNTLVFMGNQPELSRFINQFVDMASNTARQAEADGRMDVANRFLELVQKAEDLRRTFSISPLQP